ncbi:diphthine--ammonia ligase [archaeon]|nr:diphthine--ammonia ligase [archaeon]NCP78974.1 diphthine--ammonia ligase [archaeon]NCQ06741.1 diphthine--ammonia ligase [archaeon]NCQ50537.1 diphthine--ammonia ligase [archaeon]NCT57979.1 diphthine--ammonia ligase [archaeon]
MCSIIGFVNYKETKKEIISAFKTLEKRGLDGYGVFCNDKCSYFKEIKEIESKNIPDDVVFGHNLLSITGNVSQPIIIDKKVLLSNCEIYNYKELSSKYKIDSKNDSDFLLKAIIKIGKKIFTEINGPYAICYYDGREIYLRRDLLGIKPLWYSIEKKSFGFASEKKVLENAGFKKIEFLDPRKELSYNVLKNKISFKQIPFFKIEKKQTTKEKVYEKLKNAIFKRASGKQKIALLYSSGIDSLVIAKILKDNKIPFKGYFAYSQDILNPKDLSNVLRTEKEYGFSIEKIKISKTEIEKTLPLLIERVESSNPIKIGVSLPIYFASKKARKDGCKVILSGLGSDEIFAGYSRFKESTNLLKDTLNLLYQMHENDLYREDVVCTNNNIEARFPYLDKEVIEESFCLTDKQKINNEENKVILREIGKEIGLLKEDYKRKKTAAQYGSGFDKMIEKIAKENNVKQKGEFLKKLSKKENLTLGCLFSGGKDSNLAYHIMARQNYKIACLMTMVTENPDSYMFQKIDEKILSLQSKALEVPFVFQKTKGIKEEELKDLKRLLFKAKEKYSLQGIITGAIKSNYQRERIQDVCNELGLRMFSPLWNKTQEGVLKELLDDDYQVMIVKIAGQGLSENWLGKVLTKEDVINLKIINKKKGINVAGEGGEYESIVLDAPLYKQKIVITSANPIMENEITGYLDILKLGLEEK